MSQRTVFIEESKTPIYRRIANALGAELVRHGMEVMVVKPDGFNTGTFHEFVARQGAAAYVSNSVGNAIQARIPGKDEYFFERFPGKVIFLHQDAILGGAHLLPAISKLQAWQRVAERSTHLCIEPDNVADLIALGIKAKLVPHATEIEPAEPSTDDFGYGSTFVGHVVPSMYSPACAPPNVQNLIDEAMRLRQADMAAPLEPLVKAYAEQALGGLGNPADQAVLRVASAQWLRSQITNQSMPMRGWVFENCTVQPVDIFGGDPAYLHNVDRKLEIVRAGVSYHPAVYEPADVQRIFNKSLVNVNISSLQFDHAVVNRFHDVTMAGGLCLTDTRQGLPELTPLHAEVSYRNLDELRDRIDHFSRPENFQQRALLVKALQKDITRNSGYPLLARAIISTLDEL
ncbi:hypothetical protein [Aquabacterium sp.]|uniref:glycosyltransferase family protein n=1 Tax=Aquabacterium sp. TaxID=1872578 RepID=UPI001984C216|nr:hypothetical protein [Aquabacterium sp.]MBC7700932.1 hypothetical protein [Aquabacterium sp.]